MRSHRDFGIAGALMLGSLGGLIGGWIVKHLGLTTPDGSLAHADRVATFGGSWTFIVMFLTALVIWMIVNEEIGRPFDVYPFILLNLVLSCVAALQAPVIMMSQNRQAVKDRFLRARWV